MHSIVTTFIGAVIKVEVANFCAAMDTLIDQDGVHCIHSYSFLHGACLQRQAENCARSSTRID